MQFCTVVSLSKDEDLSHGCRVSNIGGAPNVVAALLLPSPVRASNTALDMRLSSVFTLLNGTFLSVTAILAE